jgi:hypothetical protein
MVAFTNSPHPMLRRLFGSRTPPPATPALQLAGFTLAHALWSVSDTPPDELLCPLAFIERRGERDLIRFEAETQAEAIAHGKDTVTSASSRADCWGFAHEGAWRPPELEGDPQDVITVACWERGMSGPSIVVQPFARGDGSADPTTGLFRVIGKPRIAIEGTMFEADAAASAVREVMTGVMSHDAVAPLWPTWTR